jgi:hypothetical protein
MDPFDRLRAGGIMEMRVPGLGMYAELLLCPAVLQRRRGRYRALNGKRGT